MSNEKPAQGQGKRSTISGYVILYSVDVTPRLRAQNWSWELTLPKVPSLLEGARR